MRQGSGRRQARIVAKLSGFDGLAQLLDELACKWLGSSSVQLAPKLDLGVPHGIGQYRGMGGSVK